MDENHAPNGRFAKGNCANPAGRPRKKRALSALLRSIGAHKTDDGIPKRRALAEKVWELALDGDLAAARLIYEYCDGKPPQSLDVTTGGEKLPQAANVIIVRETVKPDVGQ